MLEEDDYPDATFCWKGHCEDVRFPHIDRSGHACFEKHDELKWIGNDPALLYALFRDKMSTERE